MCRKERESVVFSLSIVNPQRTRACEKKNAFLLVAEEEEEEEEEKRKTRSSLSLSLCVCVCVCFISLHHRASR